MSYLESVIVYENLDMIMNAVLWNTKFPMFASNFLCSTSRSSL